MLSFDLSVNVTKSEENVKLIKHKVNDRFTLQLPLD